MILYRTIVSYLKNREYRDLLFTTTVIVGIGIVIYHYLENWSWLDSLYFSVITLTTIGYGDYSPQTNEGKLFTIFYIIIGVGIILSFINTVYSQYTWVKSENNQPKK